MQILNKQLRLETTNDSFFFICFFHDFSSMTRKVTCSPAPVLHFKWVRKIPFGSRAGSIFRTCTSQTEEKVCKHRNEKKTVEKNRWIEMFAACVQLSIAKLIMISRWILCNILYCDCKRRYVMSQSGVTEYREIKQKKEDLCHKIGEELCSWYRICVCVLHDIGRARARSSNYVSCKRFESQRFRNSGSVSVLCVSCSNG